VLNPYVINADLKINGIGYFQFNVTMVIDNMKNISVYGESRVIYVSMPTVKWTFRREMANLSEVNEYIQSNRFYLPLQEMADTHIFGKKLADNTHFQCAFINKWPAEVI